MEFFGTFGVKVILGTILVSKVNFSLLISYFNFRRTLFNRFIVSLCWNTIQYILTVMPAEIFRYTCGPLSNSLCFANVLLKNVLNINVCLFVNAVAVARYVSLFVTDQISEAKEAYWSFFVNIWIATFSVLSQVIFLYFPGRQPLNYYICLGEDISEEMKGESVKINYIAAIVNLVTVAIQMFVALKVLKLKFDMEKSQGNFSTASFFKAILSEIRLLVSVFMIIGLYVYLISKVQLSDPENIKKYPQFYYFYALNYFLPLCSLSGISILIYIKRDDLRITVFESILALFRTNHQA